MKNKEGASAVSLPDQSDGGPIKVIMIYDTFDAGVRGRKFVHYLERDLGEACGLNCGIWRSDLLDVPGCREGAVGEAVAADMMVVSVSDEPDDLKSIRLWLEGWLPNKSLPSALVVLSEEPVGVGGAEGSSVDGSKDGGDRTPVIDLLTRAADEAGMDVFINTTPTGCP